MLGADGRLLAANPATAALAGRPPSGERPRHRARAPVRRAPGRPPGRAAALRRPRRRHGQAPPGRSVHATIRPGLQRAAAAALGGKLGGVAVVRPRDGVGARAGRPRRLGARSRPGRRSRSSPCPARWRRASRRRRARFPVRTSATLSGVTLRNAGGESCGGSLTQAFIDSCNSVFAPLGAKLGAKRLVRMAEAFGFNERPRVPDAKPSTIPPAAQADRQPRGRRERDRPGPRPRHAAADGGGRGDDRRARAPRAPAHRAQRQGPAPARGQRARRRRRCAR